MTVAELLLLALTGALLIGTVTVTWWLLPLTVLAAAYAGAVGARRDRGHRGLDAWRLR